MKPMLFTEAVHAVGRLNPDYWASPQPEPLSKDSLASWDEVLRSHTTVNEFMATLDGSIEDLATLRAMLCAELCGRAREAVACIILTRHESILRQHRVAAVLDYHPTLAVYWDKKHSQGVRTSRKVMKTDHLATGWPRG